MGSGLRRQVAFIDFRDLPWRITEAVDDGSEAFRVAEAEEEVRPATLVRAIPIGLEIARSDGSSALRNGRASSTTSITASV